MAEVVDADSRTHPWVAEARARVRFGIFGGLGPDWSANVAWARLVEALGFDSLWVSDHPSVAASDCWAALAVLATATTRIRLGPLVSAAAGVWVLPGPEHAVYGLVSNRLCR